MADNFTRNSLQKVMERAYQRVKKWQETQLAPKPVLKLRQEELPPRNTRKARKKQKKSYSDSGKWDFIFLPDTSFFFSSLSYVSWWEFSSHRNFRTRQHGEEIPPRAGARG